MTKITIGSDRYKTFFDWESSFNIRIDPKTTYTTYQKALAATLYDRTFTDEPVVLVSGGLDSELAAVVACRYGITNHFVHFEYQMHGMIFNSHDRYWVERLSQKLGSTLEVIPIDVGAFFEREKYISWARSYQINSPQIALQVACLDQINRPVIMGGNLTQGPGTPQSASGMHGAHRYWHATNKVGVELLQDSYALYNLSLSLPSNFALDRIASGKRKSQLFNSWELGFHFQERPKHTGFELIQQHYANEGKDWNQLFRLNTLQNMIPNPMTLFI